VNDNYVIVSLTGFLLTFGIILVVVYSEQNNAINAFHTRSLEHGRRMTGIEQGIEAKSIE
jgi:hypothetical protein